MHFKVLWSCICLSAKYFRRYKSSCDYCFPLLLLCNPCNGSKLKLPIIKQKSVFTRQIIFLLLRSALIDSSQTAELLNCENISVFMFGFQLMFVFWATPSERAGNQRRESNLWTVRDRTSWNFRFNQETFSLNTVTLLSLPSLLSPWCTNAP